MEPWWRSRTTGRCSPASTHLKAGRLPQGSKMKRVMNARDVTYCGAAVVVWDHRQDRSINGWPTASEHRVACVRSVDKAGGKDMSSRTMLQQLVVPTSVSTNITLQGSHSEQEVWRHKVRVNDQEGDRRAWSSALFPSHFKMDIRPLHEIIIFLRGKPVSRRATGENGVKNNTTFLILFAPGLFSPTFSFSQISLWANELGLL